MPKARDGESTRATPLLSLHVGGWGIFLVKILSASMCVLMGFFAFGTRFQSRHFARKDISWRVRNRMLNKIAIKR